MKNNKNDQTKEDNKQSFVVFVYMPARMRAGRKLVRSAFIGV